VQTSENLQNIMHYLPVKVREALRCMNPSQTDKIQEIRLRCGRPAGIVLDGREIKLTPECIISTEEISRTFQAVCSYSVYSYEQELSEGYITLPGGCRVGISGSAVRQEQNVRTLKYINSLNFRIAGEFIGIAEQIFSQTSGSILIMGAVGSGKTTYLRDMCRLTGNHHRTALIDERGELASVQRGIPVHDVGLMTDIFDGYPRAAGIITALRVMSPEYIICDEISTESDVQAILQASGCGVRFAASCHAGSFAELRQRAFLRPLLDRNIFRYGIFLQDRAVKQIRRLTES